MVMWYVAWHMALTCVEEILTHSYSLCDMVLSKSPTTFGTVLASLEDIAWAVGIEQYIVATTPADRNKVCEN
jgi:hypothetical protein